MPFQSNSYQPQYDPAHPSDGYYGTANALYQAGQPLGSVGAPTSQWSSTKNNSYDDRYYQSSYTNGNGIAEQDLALRSVPPPYATQHGLPATPRRQPTFSRQSEELHIPHGGSAMSDIHHYGTAPSYGGDGLSMNIVPSTPQQPQHPASAAGNSVPGSLQPGMTSRPGPLSSNTSPSLPTLPQISTQLQQPQRTIPLSSSHGYSKSSPGNMDQTKYKPFSNTPENQKYASPTSSNYIPQTPQGHPSTSPLGLADIRSRTDAALLDGPLSPGMSTDSDALQYPSNSNYVAPWPIYAVDWCKWPPRASNATLGKIAMGSYLEDNHNFVSRIQNVLPAVLTLKATNTRG